MIMLYSNNYATIDANKNGYLKMLRSVSLKRCFRFRFFFVSHRSRQAEQKKKKLKKILLTYFAFSLVFFFNCIFFSTSENLGTIYHIRLNSSTR